MRTYVAGRRRHVGQPAPDALRRALRGRDRRPARRARHADGDDRRHALRVGRHPDQGRRARRARRSGDVLVTPATGAYGYAMANNYNGVPRPPVIFCRDGRGARGRPPRDLRGPRGARRMSEPLPSRPARSRDGRVGVRRAARRARRRDRGRDRAPARDRRRADALARRLRRDPRRRRRDRRADRRHRAGARVRAARRSRRASRL